MQVLNLLVGPTCYNFCEESERIDFVERSTSEQTKDQKINVVIKIRLDDVNVIEKGQLYRAGIAD